MKRKTQPRTFQEWWDSVGHRLGPELEAAREAWFAAAAAYNVPVCVACDMRNISDPRCVQMEHTCGE